MPHASTRIVAQPDVLILGGTTAAAAAALALADAGRRVLLATPRTYLGEDLTAFARLADAPGTASTMLARRIFARGVPTPMHVKETLERELLHAGVEILFGCHSGGAIVDQTGRVCGAALMTRSGRHAVLAGAAIDATWTATLARQAGCRFRNRGPQTVQCAWTLSCPAAPEGAAPAGSVTWHVDETTPRELPLWRHSFTATIDVDRPGSLAAVEVDARRRYFHEQQHFTADAVFFVPSTRLDSGGADLGKFQAAPGLWVLSAAADLSDAEAAAAIVPCEFMSLGQRVGQAIARFGVQPSGCALEDKAKLQLQTGRGAEPIADLRLDGRDLRGAITSDASGIDLGRSLPTLAEVDVLVVGGGTAGAAAGIAAARDGRKTLVVEALFGLGGIGTWGQIATYFAGYRQGFTAEVDAGVALMGPAERHLRKGSWRVEWKRAWWLKALAESGSQLWFDTIASGVQMEGNRVMGVVIAGPAGCGLIRARCVIDSTGAGDLAAAAGAEVLVPGIDQAAVQGAGLSPREPGRDYANSDHNFTDDADVRDVTRSFIAARRKFRERFDLAPILSTRERRRIVAEVMIQPEDIYANRSWPDAVNIAASSFDTHGFTIHPLFTALPPTKNVHRASVPLRALLPRGIEGLLVTGLGMGAHRDAMPVLRMQPCLQNQGYAAGLVASAAVETGGIIRKVDLKPVQDRLIQLSILDEAARAADPFPLPDSAIDAAISAERPTHFDLSVLFAHRDRAIPRLKTALSSATDSARRERLAMLLGLMGDAGGAAVLADAINARPWDQGWNFRGMDQFNESRSELDSLIWAAAGAPCEDLFQPVLKKLRGLVDGKRHDSQIELSHAQSISAACAALAKFDAKHEFNDVLARLLTYHRVAGNHQSDWEAVFSDLPRVVNHDEARSRALRELALAVGLYRCGDHEDIGKKTLERYAKDWRGPLAHHARAVLAGC